MVARMPTTNSGALWPLAEGSPTPLPEPGSARAARGAATDDDQAGSYSGWLDEGVKSVSPPGTVWSKLAMSNTLSLMPSGGALAGASIKQVI
jgi:hypothetical protein